LLRRLLKKLWRKRKLERLLLSSQKPKLRSKNRFFMTRHRMLDKLEARNQKLLR
jgi:hypothetical protein